jgi:hypothetical protein
MVCSSQGSDADPGSDGRVTQWIMVVRVTLPLYAPAECILSQLKRESQPLDTLAMSQSSFFGLSETARDHHFA